MIYWGYLQVFKLYRIVQEVFCPIQRLVKIRNIEYPWLWIGAVFDETNVVNVTDTVNTSVSPGLHVDRIFLESVTGLQPNLWRYLDTTLNEVEFPDGGITIPDDTIE